MTVAEALSSASILNIPPTRVFPRASIDSRSLQEGELFFAIHAGRDGHAFAPDALAKGAGGLVLDHLPAELPDNAPIILVEDTLTALQSVARLHRQLLDPTVTAITGSVGKTTTKEFVAQLLEKRHSVRYSQKSFNNRFGVPLTLLELDSDDDQLVVELGADRVGSIRELASLVEPDLAIITKIGYAHVGKFGSLDATLRAKLEILENLPTDGVAIVNGDDERLLDIPSLPASVRQVRCGFSEPCSIRASVDEVSEGLTKGMISTSTGSYPYQLTSVGEHLIYAAMFAVAVAVEVGMDPEEAIESISHLVPPAGRQTIFSLVGRHQHQVIDDTYNSSPDALASALRTLASLPVEQRVAVLGEMKELGAYSAEAHRNIGRLAAKFTDLLVLNGDDMGFLAEGAIEEGLPKDRIVQVRSALEAIQPVSDFLANAQSPVGVLVKGSRFRHMERVVLALRQVTEVKCGLSDCLLYINCIDCPALARGAEYAPSQALR